MFRSQRHRVKSFHELRDGLRALLREHGADESLCDDLVLATQEACNNAVLHGGDGPHLDAVFTVMQNTIIIEVADRGCGFNFPAVVATWPPDPSLSGGRGLYLVKSLADQVEVVHRRQGTVIRMYKRIA